MAPASIKMQMDPARPIAVVDDNSDDQFFLEREIQFLFGERKILTFRNGTSLLHYLQEHAGQDLPSLVLLDLHMAGIDGFSILEYMRSRIRFAAIPVVVVSGTLDKLDVREAMRCGATAFLPKPLSRGDFIKILSGKETLSPDMHS